MKRLLIAVLALFFALTAANKAILDNSKVTGYKIGSETESYLELGFNVKDINYADVTTEKGVFTSVTIDNGTLTGKAGSPAMPAYNKMIAMPFGATPEVDVISYETKSYKLSDLGIMNPLMPAQPSYSKSSKPEDRLFIYNGSSYKSSKFNESPIASVTVSGTMRGIGVGVISVEPIRYNPSTGEITVYNNVKVKVNFIGADPRAAEIAKAEYSPFFESAYAQMINYKPLDTKADITTYPITYLILANSGLNGNADLNRLIAWKKQKGFNVIVNYVAAASTITTNDTWIEGQYNTLNPKPSFVLVIGDHDGTYGVLSEVNPPLGSDGVVTRSDLLYGVMGATSSTNKIPSMYVGRFTVRALADLTAQVDKTLWYEKEQFLVATPDLNYLTYTLGVAGVDAANAEPFGDPQIYYGWTYYFNAAHGMANSQTYYSNESDATTADAEIVSFISNGAAFYNYTAHGAETVFADPSFTIANIDGLTNTNKYPIMVGNCCLTGSFGTTECFGEALLNAPNKGAVGYIGASMSTYWNEDLTMAVGMDVNGQPAPALDVANPGMYDGIMALGYSSVGAMKHVGLMAVDNNNQTWEDDYWSAYHTFGDPSIMPYMGIPAVQTATHDGVIAPGATTYTVTTTPYAYVAMGDQSGVLHGAARANSSGVAVVPVTAYTVGNTGKLVITAQFKRPFYADVLCTGSTGGTFAINQTSLSYGNVAAGTSSIKTFQITNSHTTEYLLGDITTITGYLVSAASKETKNVLSYSVAPQSSKVFNLAFEPTAAQTYNGNVTITSTDTGHATTYIAVTGTGEVTPLSVPSLSLPANGSTTNGPAPAFDWSDVSGATSYTIQADNNSDFSSPEINQSVAASSYTPATALAIGTYYWKVKAVNAYTSSSYTSSWTLTIAPYTLPFSENFNAAASLPLAWQIKDNQGNGQVWVVGTHTSGLTGTGNYAYLNSDGYGSGNTQNSDIITPTIDMTNTFDITLSFSHYYYHYTGSSVTLSYSINGGGTWTQIQTWSATTGSAAVPAVFNQIIAAVGGQANVKFKWNYIGTYGYYWDVDNISVTGTYTGPAGGTFAINQTALSYGSVSTGSTSVKQFTITNSHGTETLTGNITTITGYTASVAAKDSKNILSYAVSPNSSKTFDLTFSPVTTGTYNGNIVITSSDTNHATQNIAVTGTGTGPSLPFAESFEGTTFQPAGWTVTNVNGTTGIWSRVTAGTYPTCSPQSGTAMAKYNSFNCSDGVKVRLATPQISFAGYSAVTMKFWMYHDPGYTGDLDSLEVYASADGTNWTKLKGYQRYSATAGWVENTVSLSSYDGQSVYLGFQGCSAYGNNMFIDNISIAGTLESLGAPANVASSISGTDMTISWEETAGAVSYDLYSADDPYGTFNFVTNVATTQFTIPMTASKKFFYVIASSEVKTSPAKIEVKTSSTK